MLQDLRGILYDLDGVLVKSAPAWYRVLVRACARFGTPSASEEEFRACFGQGIEADRARFFPSASVAEIASFYEEAFPEEIEAVEIPEGAMEVLSAARAGGLRQAVVTNAPRNLARRIITAKSLDKYVDACAAAGEAPEKPAPDLILLALSRLGLAASEALYVGDTPTDAEAARRAGVRLAGLGIAGDIKIASLLDLLAVVR